MKLKKRKSIIQNGRKETFSIKVQNYRNQKLQLFWLISTAAVARLQNIEEHVLAFALNQYNREKNVVYILSNMSIEIIWAVYLLTTSVIGNTVLHLCIKFLKLQNATVFEAVVYLGLQMYGIVKKKFQRGSHPDTHAFW